MKQNLTWKWITLAVVLAFSVGSYWNSGRQYLEKSGHDPAKITATDIFKHGMKLGLDLKGGIHLVLRVKTDEALIAVTDEELDRVRRKLEEKGLAPTAAERKNESSFEMTFASAEAADGAVKAVEANPEFETNASGSTVVVRMASAAAIRLRDDTVRQAIQTIENRINEFGVSEPVIQAAGGERILVQLPGVDDPARAKRLLKETAQLFLKIAEAGPVPSREAAIAAYPAGLPPNLEIREGEREDEFGEVKGSEWWILRKTPIVTGRDLRSARRSQDQFGAPSIAFALNPQGAEKFGRGTGENIGKMLAIVLDGKVKSAPRINGQIFDSGVIEGRFTVERAEDLALVLRAGALPASMEYLEERAVGPALGADSIRKGLLASLIGCAAVYVFMVFYYRAAGVNAIIALTLNAIILIGVMASFGATLTLPGIAGFVLTIGMAVDANVLIFERIRDEVKSGKTVRSAIAGGFGKAFWTIMDSNITTLIAAVFLFQFGTGPVKGFAVTLTIGILASMFTAIFVSRLFFDWLHSGREHVDTLSI